MTRDARGAGRTETDADACSALLCSALLLLLLGEGKQGAEGWVASDSARTHALLVSFVHNEFPFSFLP